MQNKTAVFLIVLLLSSQLMALSPQIEADRLSLQSKTALDVKDFDLAMQSLEKIQTLEVKLPDTFYFHLTNNECSSYLGYLSFEIKTVYTSRDCKYSWSYYA